MAARRRSACVSALPSAAPAACSITASGLCLEQHSAKNFTGRRMPTCATRRARPCHRPPPPPGRRPPRKTPRPSTARSASRRTGGWRPAGRPPQMRWGRGQGRVNRPVGEGRCVARHGAGKQCGGHTPGRDEPCASAPRQHQAPPLPPVTLAPLMGSAHTATVQSSEQVAITSLGAGTAGGWGAHGGARTHGVATPPRSARSGRRAAQRTSGWAAQRTSERPQLCPHTPQAAWRMAAAPCRVDVQARQPPAVSHNLAVQPPISLQQEPATGGTHDHHATGIRLPTPSPAPAAQWSDLPPRGSLCPPPSPGSRRCMHAPRGRVRHACRRAACRLTSPWSRTLPSRMPHTMNPPRTASDTQGARPQSMLCSSLQGQPTGRVVVCWDETHCCCEQRNGSWCPPPPGTAQPDAPGAQAPLQPGCAPTCAPLAAPPPTPPPGPPRRS